MSRHKGPRIECTATVNPIGKRPFPDRAQLSYRNDAELSEQLRKYAKHKWPEAYQIKVDTTTRTILINGRAVAHYHLNLGHESDVEQETLGVGA
ncbi:MAG: hypothetical protein J7474_11480 [Arthrobacter sp.]|nr:hypothetical protein [Arthrobacter sp.]